MEGGPFGNINPETEWLLFLGQLKISPDDKELLQKLVKGEKVGILTILVRKGGPAQVEQVEISKGKTQSQLINEISEAIDALAGEDNDLAGLEVIFDEELTDLDVYNIFVDRLPMDLVSKELLKVLVTTQETGEVTISLDNQHSIPVTLGSKMDAAKRSVAIIEAVVELKDTITDDKGMLHATFAQGRTLH